MKTLEELRKIRDKAKKEMQLRNSEYRIKVVVGMGTSGIAVGARDVMKAIFDEVTKRKLDHVLVAQTGEKGLSSMEPVIDIIEKDKSIVTYGHLTPENARKIIVEHVVNGRIVSDFVVATKTNLEV